MRHASWRDVNETPGDLNFGFVCLYLLSFCLTIAGFLQVQNSHSLNNYDKHHQINNNNMNDNSDEDDDDNNNNDINLVNLCSVHCACKTPIRPFKGLIQII